MQNGDEILLRNIYQDSVPDIMPSAQTAKSGQALHWAIICCLTDEVLGKPARQQRLNLISASEHIQPFPEGGGGTERDRAAQRERENGMEWKISCNE